MKNNQLLKIALLSSLLVFVSSCLENEGTDYAKKIGDSDYYFTRNSSIGTYIWKKANNGGQEVIVKRRIVEYQFDSEHIAAIRQIANSYECAERTIATELKDQYEYWLISISQNNISGPLSREEYVNLVTQLGKSKSLMPSDEKIIREKNMYVELPLTECTKPVLIKGMRGQA